MTILASILIFSTGSGKVPYIDALFFASGANTQAGLNTIDVNQLNTFQQVVLYLFAMTSNPITIHSSVVFLRLYWFEKRFQGMVREARQRRSTISKTKSNPKGDPGRAEKGVNGRNITVLHSSAKNPRVANDGILPKPNDRAANGAPPSGTGTASPPQKRDTGGDSTDSAAPGEQWGTDAETQVEPVATSHGITFADTVKRSDGMGTDLTKFPPQRSDEEHMAILQRQQDTHDGEVLRIPNPRDAERGVGPKRLEEGDAPEEDREPPEVDRGGMRVRHKPTIAFEEPTRVRSPERWKRQELEDEVKAIKNTFGPLSFRKPRIFNSINKKYHVDDDSPPRRKPIRVRTMDTIRSALTREKTHDMPYLSWQPTLGRNSQFPGLTLEQREELGGIEYRSLRTLALILVCYFWLFEIFAVACLLPFIKQNDRYGVIVEQAGMSRTWWGFFTANAAFMDVGFTLTPDSMSSFSTAPFVLMIMWFLIIIGNTGFPVMLRFIIWILAHIVPKGTGFWEELRFLLDHPRRCFTLLFPSSATWWLFWILVALNGLDLIFFVTLDVCCINCVHSCMSQPANYFLQLQNGIVKDLPLNLRIVNGLFIAASTRTAGFASLSISALHPAVQTSYMIMMYISVFPIAISIRRTNVYEEKSLGMYDKNEVDDEAIEHSTMSYVGTHLRRQLSFDLWYVFLGLFVLAITEARALENKEFNMFDVLFELVSAYGTVGLSMGYPNINASLSARFSTLGKLIIIAMQIRGRHRGLPYGLDRAILLPSEQRFKEEAAQVPPGPFTRTNTSVSQGVITGLSRRQTTLKRGRSMERTPNIITSFLHPGPTVETYRHRRPSRARSFDDPRRTNSMPVETDEDEPALRQGLKPVRAKTFSEGPAVS